MKELKEIEDVLPDKLSDIIIVSLNDLNKCERSTKYLVDMVTWFNYSSVDGQCEVCLAGSVMAKTLGFEKYFNGDVDIYPAELNGSLHNKLIALDHVREYDISGALCEIGYFSSSYYTEAEKLQHDILEKLDYEMASYEYNSKIWKKNMRKIARELKKLNL